MPQLVPSVLETSKEKFLDTLFRELKLPGVQRIQVDFGDGVFVPNQILPISEIDSLSPAFHFEAHLMCSEPQDFLDYQIAGFKTIILHYEAYKNKQDLKTALRKIKSMGLFSGLAINPDTDVLIFKEFIGQIDQCLLMSVMPGFQGQAFIPQSLQRLSQLKQEIPNVIIEIDGGINETNIQQVALAGADLIILGSAITKSPNMQEAWEKINNKIK